MDVGATFIADGEPPEAVEPGQRALHDPAVASQLLAAVDALAGDAHLDVAPATGAPLRRIIISLVGMQLVGPSTGTASGSADGRDRIERRLEHEVVVAVGPADQAGERRAGSVDHNMALRARFAAIRRV